MRTPHALRFALAALALLAAVSAAMSAWPMLIAAVPLALWAAWPRRDETGIASFGADGTVRLDEAPVRSFALHSRGPLAVLTLDRRRYVLHARRELSLWFERVRDV